MITPRQAAWLATTLDMMADAVDEWLDQDPRHYEPLHGVSAFDGMDPRVMLAVNDSRAWASMARSRMLAVRDEIERGKLPFDRPGCFFDEVLMAMALPWAEGTYEDSEREGFFDAIPARNVPHAGGEVAT